MTEGLPRQRGFFTGSVARYKAVILVWMESIKKRKKGVKKKQQDFEGTGRVEVLGKVEHIYGEPGDGPVGQSRTALKDGWGKRLFGIGKRK